MHSLPIPPVVVNISGVNAPCSMLRTLLLSSPNNNNTNNNNNNDNDNDNDNNKQEDKLVLENASKEHLRRLTIIWSSTLSDHSKVIATNQYALPVLSYLMWTQAWPLAQLQQVDREARKIIVEFGGNHPQGSTAILYMSRKCGGGEDLDR